MGIIKILGKGIDVRRCTREWHSHVARPRPWAREGANGCSLSRLDLFFHRKKDNFMEKIPLKFQSDRSYGSSDIYETVLVQRNSTETERKT